MKGVRYWARIMVKNRKFLLLLRVEPKKKKIDKSCDIPTQCKEVITRV